MLPAIIELLPQRGSAVLLDCVLGWAELEGRRPIEDSRTLICRASLKADHPYMLNGQVDPIVALEMMAQATAAYASLEASTHQPAIGLLASASRIRLQPEPLGAGDVLEVSCRCVQRRGDAVRFEARVRRGEQLVAEAILTVIESARVS